MENTGMATPTPEPKTRDATVETLEGTVTQASGRLEQSEVTLDGIKMPMILEHPEQFEEWLDSVTHTLRNHCIERVINPKIPRPKPYKATSYEAWKKLSKELATWLAAGVKGDFLAKVNPRKRDLVYADDFIDHLTTVLRCHKTHEELDKVCNLLLTKSSDYPSALDFVRDFQGKFNRLRDEGVEVSAYEAVCSLMWQVNLAGHQKMYKFMVGDMRAKADDIGSCVRDTFTTADFGLTCDEVIYRLENGGPRPKASLPREKKNQPEPGISAIAHVRFWRVSVIQRDDSGMCYYCEEHPHDVTECWYLNPRLRPADWTPTEDLWVYMEGKNNGRTRIRMREGNGAATTGSSVPGTH